MGRHDDLYALAIWPKLLGLRLQERHETHLTLRMEMCLRLLNQKKRKTVAFRGQKQQVARHEQQIVRPEAAAVGASRIRGCYQSELQLLQ